MESLRFRTTMIRLISLTLLLLIAEAACLTLLYRAINQKTDHIISERTLTASLQADRAHFEALEQDYRSIEPFLSTIRGALVTPEDLYRVLDAVQQAGVPHGLSLSLSLDTSIPASTDIEGVRQVRFSMVFDGTYEKLRAYLASLRALPVFIDVDSVSMDGASLLQGGTIRLHGVIYLQ